MNIKEILQILSEDGLRKKVIIPMMSALGCIDVYDTHGPYEKGKDVVYGIKHLLKKKIYGAIIVKNKGNINKGRSLDNLYRQAKDALKEFENPNDPSGSKVKIHELIIMTAFEVTVAASTYIFENCGVNFPNLHIVDGNTLESIIRELISEYKIKNNKKYQFNIDTFKDFCERKSERTISMSEPIIRAYYKKNEK
jgi:hypothetical protein